MKGLSVAAGFFLVVAGILGCTSLVLGGGIIYFIGALYAIAFGLVVIVVEFKDKTPIISIAYKLIDKYLKFLTIQVHHTHRVCDNTTSTISTARVQAPEPESWAPSRALPGSRCHITPLRASIGPRPLILRGGGCPD